MTHQRGTIVSPLRAVLPSLVILALSAASTTAQSGQLGAVHFPTSGSDQAQERFIEGILLLHSFEYEDAAEAFKAAQALDPDFAMAYWGEAMSYNHPIWMQQDRPAAMEALERLGPTPEARAAKAHSARERAYLQALETLYGNTDRSRGKIKEERDDLYRDEMRRLYESYPDDQEAGAFYALAILGTAHEGRDFATYMRAAAVVEPIFEANKKHPGAAHYLIHSYDDPIHAPLGLPMARAYSAIAPAAAHAQHMTSHIFVAMGLWDDVVDANIVARDVQNARLAELGRRPNVCGHYTYWLEYGLLMQGRIEDARSVLDSCYERIQGDPNGSELGYFASMRARYMVDSGDWAAADHYTHAYSSPNWTYEAGSALSALMSGDVDDAREIHARLASAVEGRESSGATVPSVLERMLAGVILARSGDAERGIEMLSDAADLEASMPYEFGPPVLVKPTFELLGELLLDVGRSGDAEVAFRTQLDRTPLRATSLLGLAEAASAVGDAVAAAEAYGALERIWHDADRAVKQQIATRGDGRP